MNKVCRIRLLLPVIITMIGYLNADGQSPALQTDRPRLTFVSALVGDGVIQLESGVRFTWEERGGKDTYYHLISEYGLTRLRFGLLENFELSLMSGYMSGWIRSFGGDTISGMLPIRFGARIGITEQIRGWPEVAFYLGITAPRLGNSHLPPGYADPEVRFCFSHRLSERLILGYNLGGYYERNGLNFRYSAALSGNVLGPLNLFVEIQGQGEGTYTYMFNYGAMLEITKDLLLDVASGLNVNDESLSHITAGISWRYGADKSAKE